MRSLLAAALLAFSFSTANAYGIAQWELGPWAVCTSAPKAYNLADLYASGEGVMGDVFYQYMESGDCFVLPYTQEFFLQAVVHRVGKIRVVRVADRENNEWYWVTALPIVGEPQPVDKDF